MELADIGYMRRHLGAIEWAARGRTPSSGVAHRSRAGEGRDYRPGPGAMPSSAGVLHRQDAEQLPFHIGLIQLILPGADHRRPPPPDGRVLLGVQAALRPAVRPSPTTSPKSGGYYRDYVELMAHFDDVAAGPGASGDLRRHGREHRKARCAIAGHLGLRIRAGAAWPSTTPRARCARSAPSRCDGRSSATGWTNGATTSPGSAR